MTRPESMSYAVAAAIPVVVILNTLYAGGVLILPELVVLVVVAFLVLSWMGWNGGDR